MFKTLEDLDTKNKRVLVRCDFNVPLDKDGNISDDFRIVKALATIRYLMEKKAKIILMSHLGEPEGKEVKNLKLGKVQKRISEILGIPVEKSDDCIGREVKNLAEKLDWGQILLLENLRFHKQETGGDLNFAKKLSELGDIYVNDAFGVCHRNHASVFGVPKFLPGVAGFLLKEEIENLNKILQNPERPMAAVVGGKKVETKSKFIDKISEVADFVIISGLLKKEIADKNLKLKEPQKIIGPEDDLAALDIDEKTIDLFKKKILQAKTVLWNGPFGKFEDKNYEKGTLAIANAIIGSGAFSVVGGGETVEFIAKKGIIKKFSWVSTGGGAMMAYLSGERLPGLEALANF